MDAAVVGELTGLLGVMVPIVAIVLGIGVAFWSIYWDHRKKQLQYDERRLMIENGMTPPALDGGSKATLPEDSLRVGIIMTFIGIGLGIAYLIMLNSESGGPPDWIFGVGAVIVGMLGLGNLLYYRVAQSRGEQEHTRRS